MAKLHPDYVKLILTLFFSLIFVCFFGCLFLYCKEVLIYVKISVIRNFETLIYQAKKKKNRNGLVNVEAEWITILTGFTHF